MNRPAAALLGVVCIAPLVAFVYLVVAALSVLPMPPFGAPGATLAPSLPEALEAVRAGLEGFGTLAAAQFLLTVAVTVGLIVYTYRGAAVPAEKRRLWVVVLVLGGFLAFPVFWFHYIWRRP